jgi:hypothetical protein
MKKPYLAFFQCLRITVLPCGQSYPLKISFGGVLTTFFYIMRERERERERDSEFVCKIDDHGAHARLKAVCIFCIHWDCPAPERVTSVQQRPAGAIVCSLVDFTHWSFAPSCLLSGFRRSPKRRKAPPKAFTSATSMLPSMLIPQGRYLRSWAIFYHIFYCM